ncbi:AraC family transcriptional regulator [Herbaspirillum lusitanum]|uniref:AraC family transcriptional regulator n=1 Tax=Herbaspirillum lusitanum TaxID=213312 RepID=A0ABW9A9J6_9BURK
MPTSLISGLPYMPSLHPVNAFSTHHLKYALDDLVGPGDIRTDAALPGTLSACRLVGGGVMIIAALPAGTMVRHEWEHVAGLESNDVLASIVLEGKGCVSQNGVELQFNAGDVFYRKARMPSTVQNASACRFLLLRFSFSRFNGAHTSRFDRFMPTLARRDSPLRSALWQYAQEVLPALSGAHSETAGHSLNTIYHAEQAFVSLLSAVYAESQQAETAPAAGAADKQKTRWETLVSTLDAMLCEPDLSVSQLSQALGISPRLVHRLFASHGHRYSNYLLERRLERAHSDLCSPACSKLSVSDIGFRVGFNNASHFSRSFRHRYGVPPSALRGTASSTFTSSPDPMMPAHA